MSGPGPLGTGRAEPQPRRPRRHSGRSFPLLRGERRGRGQVLACYPGVTSIRRWGDPARLVLPGPAHARSRGALRGRGSRQTYFSVGAWHHSIVGRGDVPGVHVSRQEAVRAGVDLAIARHAHHQVWYAGGRRAATQPGGGESPTDLARRTVASSPPAEARRAGDAQPCWASTSATSSLVSWPPKRSRCSTRRSSASSTSPSASSPAKSSSGKKEPSAPRASTSPSV